MRGDGVSMSDAMLPTHTEVVRRGQDDFLTMEPISAAIQTSRNPTSSVEKILPGPEFDWAFLLELHIGDQRHGVDQLE